MAEFKPVRADFIERHYPGTGTAGERAPARRQSGRLSAAESPPPRDLLAFGVFHPSKKTFYIPLRSGKPLLWSARGHEHRETPVKVCEGFIWSRGVRSSLDATADGLCCAAVPRQGPAGTRARVLVQPFGKWRKKRHFWLCTHPSPGSTFYLLSLVIILGMRKQLGSSKTWEEMCQSYNDFLDIFPPSNESWLMVRFEKNNCH